jgi:Glycosyltransferase family 87
MATPLFGQSDRRTRWLASPIVVGTLRFPPPGLVALAAIGGSLLLILAATEWRHLNDEYAYWLAGARLASGAPLYDPTAQPNTPYAYWYPPPMAQVMAPITSVVSADAFAVAWTALLLVCLWWLGGRNVLVALALIAFLPVAVELRVRNVHLVIAVLAVLALRRSSLFWIPAAALKITPVLGLAYLAAAQRWREAILAGLAGLAVLAVSLVLAPSAWQQFVDVVGLRAGADGGSVFPIPFGVRFIVGAALVVVAGRLALRATRDGASPRWAETLLIVALTIANPTLWVTAMSLLVAIVPLWRTAPGGHAPQSNTERVGREVIAT